MIASLCLRNLCYVGLHTVLERERHYIWPQLSTKFPTYNTPNGVLEIASMFRWTGSTASDQRSHNKYYPNPLIYFNYILTILCTCIFVNKLSNYQTIVSELHGTKYLQYIFFVICQFRNHGVEYVILQRIASTLHRYLWGNEKQLPGDQTMIIKSQSLRQLDWLCI